MPRQCKRRSADDVADQLGQDALDNYYKCIVDESYDDLTDDSLRSLADGEEPKASADSDDATAFTDAATTCSQSLMEDAMGDMDLEGVDN